jgi:hypothetical protein
MALLRTMGVAAELKGHASDTEDINFLRRYEHVKKMRASIYVLDRWWRAMDAKSSGGWQRGASG